MGRKQAPKPKLDRFSQTSIEESIQNMKNLSRKQMERKLMPHNHDEIINISEYNEYFRSKSHSELGIQKFVPKLFSVDSDEDNDNTSGGNVLKQSPRVTPLKPKIIIGVNRPVASSTPLFSTNRDISSNLQQSPIGNDTSDTTIRNTSSAYGKTTIQVLEDITLTPSKPHNYENETRRSTMQAVSSGSGKKTSAANVVVPLNLSKKTYDMEQKSNNGKKKVAAENKSAPKASNSQQLTGVGNKAVISAIPVDPARVKKKRAPRKEQSGTENNGGPPRKITKIQQTPDRHSDKNGSVNMAHLANCVYGTGTTSADPKNNGSGINRPPAIENQDCLNCSPSKKRKTEDKDKLNISQRKVESIFEADVIKLRDQLISVGKLPSTCTTTNRTELQALLNQNTSNASISHNPTLAEKPNTSEKSNDGTSKGISNASGTAENGVGSGVTNKSVSNSVPLKASATGESTRAHTSSANTAVRIERPTQVLSNSKVTQVAESSTPGLPKRPTVPSLSTENVSVSLQIVLPNVPITLTVPNCGKGPDKQTDPGTSTKKSHVVAATVTQNTSGPDQSATKISGTSASESSGSTTSELCTRNSAKPSSEKDSYKKILSYDEALQRLTSKSCVSFGISPTKTSAATGASAPKSSGSSSDICPRTPAKPSLEKSPYKRILSYDEARQRPNLQNCGSSGISPTKPSTLPATPSKSTTASPSSIEKTPTKSSAASNFEKTPTKRRLFQRSPRKMSMSPRSPKKQCKSMNNRHLELIKEKVFNVLKKSLHAKDIVKGELDIMEKFFKADVRYQYVCLKLLTYQWKWYNVHKFCKQIEVDMDDNEIATMYEYLKNKGYVETDYEKSEDIPHLLHLLDCTDLRSVCDTFKLNNRVKKKEEMIELLLKYCKTQSTLTFGKSSRDLLLEKIKDKMGASIKVKAELRHAFYRLYTMATFSNVAFEDINDFFNHMLHIGVLFPEYDVTEDLVFWNRDEFLGYVDGVEERKVLEKYCVSKRHVDVLARCRDIFEKLKNLPNRDEESERFTETPHLKKFTAKSMYLSCLGKGCEYLRAKFPEDVRVWLEYLIKNFSTSHRLGQWYCNLCCIYMSKEKNYKKATNLILQAFTQHESCLNETQKFMLSEKAEMLKSSKKYKIDQLDHDRLAKFVPVPKYDFTESKIDAKTIRGNESGRKRHYVVRDADGSSSYTTVEKIALQHYLEECGYTDGGHYEGGIIKSLFNLLFWDIIYNPTTPVPASFISKFQEVPLDMYTMYFYQNRQEEIDRRIEEIRSVWSDAGLLAFARRKHIEHSHENSMCQIQSYIRDPDMLNVLIPCIGRQVLADILKRFVKDIRQYRSGLPDLMVWNEKEQKCKFVEVKGENDRLSAGQNLWINYLKSIGANVEVCIVHSIGSKRKSLKGSIKQSESMLQGESGSVAGTSATR